MLAVVHIPPGDPRIDEVDYGEVVDGLSRWYRQHARDLPWRRPGTSAWAVLISEVMLQQTPVARVAPVYNAWLARWPDAAALAAAEPGEVIRAWGRLGYPRRALRLHRCAEAIVGEHGGQVPADLDALLALPGIGAYTARAVATFAYGQRHGVVDVNVRRVVARLVTGQAEPGPTSTRRDLAAVEALLPAPAEAAVVAAIALMELGAVVCTAARPACLACPISDACSWRRNGYPPYTGVRARTQSFSGTDRQVRGLLMAVLRGTFGPVDRATLDIVWAEPIQRERALRGLIIDGLVAALPDDRFALPTR